MNKHEKIDNWVLREFGPPIGSSVIGHPCYRGFFMCFNSARYYEAHDVLEHLWLETDRRKADFAFFKGLIQLAGGFVHMKHHRREPGHRVHGKRLRPAAKLLRLAISNLEPHLPERHGLDVREAVLLARQYEVALQTGRFEQNPWKPEIAPTLTPDLPAGTPAS
jgi:predicted metal-dependent hydrolase